MMLPFNLEDPVLVKIALSIGFVLLILLLVHLSQLSVKRYIEAQETRYRIIRLSRSVGYLVSLVVIFAIFSDNLGGLAIFLGAAGAGIAFALQEVIASIAGWIAVSVGKFYRTGDRVQLGGIKGDVIDITVLRTTLMEIGEWIDSDLYTGRIVRIANSFVFKEPVFNYSSSFPFLWDEIKIPVKHGSSVDLARDILKKAAEEVIGPTVKEAQSSWKDVIRSYLIEEVQLEPQITMQITDNWLEFTVRYIVDYKKRRLTRDRLFTRIHEEVEKTKQQVAIASTTLAVVDMPEVKLRMIKDHLPGP